MCQVSRRGEISVRVPAQSAALARMMTIVTGTGAEVLASCSYWDKSGTTVLLVTDNPKTTARALTEAGFSCDTHSVVVVGPAFNPGIAPRVLPDLGAAGINILYSYVAYTEDRGGYVVMQTADNDRAMRVLEVNQHIHDLAVAKTVHAQAA